MKYIIAQLGARRHYAIPRMLHDGGMLEHFYTDICATKGWPQLLGLLPKNMRVTGVRRLLGRVPRGIPNSLITSFTQFGWTLSSRLRHIKTRSEVFEILLWAGEDFCRKVIHHGLGNADGVYTFNGAGLELMQYARSRGLRTVMEQTIAPMKIERKLLAEAQKCFPGWQEPEPDDDYVKAYIAREQAEWSESDVILCGSEFVREGIAACGGPVERCVVVPFGLAKNHFSSQLTRPAHNEPLRVLTVGAVGLRKGSPYVLEAAKKLKGSATFRMVGPLGISKEINEQMKGYVELVGPVPRATIQDHFAWADVFLLPSLCEGSAMVTYEALAAGLPVICTPNTGSIVRDGLDGYLVPERNVDSITDALNVLIEDADQLKIMSGNAKNRSSEFTLDKYSQRLLNAIKSK